MVAEDLQWDFSLHQALSLYLVETITELEPESETYVPDLITLVESILENPEIVLRKQVDKLKGELVAQLKAEGVEYEARMEKLEEVTHPKPLSDFIYGTFNRFRGKHPWVGGEDIKPKSIGREMFEGYMSFADYVKRYSLQRSEGVLLRYLSQLYKTLDQTVPELSKTEGVWDALGFFRALVETTDSSLLEEWQGLLHPEVLVRTKERKTAREILWLEELLADPKTFAGPRARRDAPAGPRPLAQGVGGGAQPRQAGPGRSPDPLGPRALRGRHGALLRGVRRAPLHPRSPPPSLDADQEDRRPRVGSHPHPPRSPGGQPLGHPGHDRSPESRRGGRADRAGGPDRGLRNNARRADLADEDAGQLGRRSPPRTPSRGSRRRAGPSPRGPARRWSPPRPR